MKNIWLIVCAMSILSCAHKKVEDSYMAKDFNPSDKAFTFTKVSEQRWQVLVHGEWNAETQKQLLKKLSQVGARHEFSYFKLDEGGRFPASEGKEQAEEVIVEYSHLNSPDFFYSVDGILERPAPKSEARPAFHRSAREY